MRWNNIPISRIHENYKLKILKQIRLNPTKIYFNHTGEQWIKAFEAKKDAEDRVHLDNIEAAMQMAAKRRRKEYEDSRVVYKLLDGICRAANLN